MSEPLPKGDGSGATAGTVRSLSKPVEPTRPARGEAVPDASAVPPGGSLHLMFIAVMTVETAFVVGMSIWARMNPDEALWIAARATGLACNVVFARAAVLRIGRRLRLTALAGPTLPTRVGLVLLATILAELTAVTVAIVALRMAPEPALWLAGKLTILCMAVIYGRPALLAVGRRLFSGDDR